MSYWKHDIVVEASKGEEVRRGSDRRGEGGRRRERERERGLLVVTAIKQSFQTWTNRNHLNSL